MDLEIIASRLACAMLAGVLDRRQSAVAQHTTGQQDGLHEACAERLPLPSRDRVGIKEPLSASALQNGTQISRKGRAGGEVNFRDKDGRNRKERSLYPVDPIDEWGTSADRGIDALGGFNQTEVRLPAWLVT